MDLLNDRLPPVIKTIWIYHTSLSLAFPLVVKQYNTIFFEKINIIQYLSNARPDFNIDNLSNAATLQTHYPPSIVSYMYLYHLCSDSPCISLAVMKPKLNVPFCSCAGCANACAFDVRLWTKRNQSSDALPGGGTVVTAWHTAQHTLGAPLG